MSNFSQKKWAGRANAHHFAASLLNHVAAHRMTNPRLLVRLQSRLMKNLPLLMIKIVSLFAPDRLPLELKEQIQDPLEKLLHAVQLEKLNRAVQLAKALPSDEKLHLHPLRSRPRNQMQQKMSEPIKLICSKIRFKSQIWIIGTKRLKIIIFWNLKH